MVWFSGYYRGKGLKNAGSSSTFFWLVYEEKYRASLASLGLFVSNIILFSVHLFLGLLMFDEILVLLLNFSIFCDRVMVSV